MPSITHRQPCRFASPRGKAIADLITSVFFIFILRQGSRLGRILSLTVPIFLPIMESFA
jgi:hypothetical protein